MNSKGLVIPALYLSLYLSQALPLSAILLTESTALLVSPSGATVPSYSAWFFVQHFVGGNGVRYDFHGECPPEPNALDLRLFETLHWCC
jgi:hypothetical protein